jgi:formate hydrogenlyase subunit 6/NADH:ubiquinone oxidoreductase subunit I
MGVLLLFNDRSELTGEEIQVATQLTEAVWRMTLLSLVKTKVLNMEPNEEITKQTRFTLNRAFKRFKLSLCITTITLSHIF